MEIKIREFYTYTLCYPNGKPFYVGKGKGHRALHFGNRFSQRVAKKIRRSGEAVIIIKNFFKSEEEAYKKEQELIWFFGRRDNGTGVLCNLSDGGEIAPKNIKLTREARHRMSLASKRNWSSDQFQQKFSRQMKKKWTDQNYISKVSAGKAKYWTPERRVAWSVKMKKRCSSITWSRKMSEQAKQTWSNHREKMVKEIRHACKGNTTRSQSISIGTTAAWKRDPSRRKTQSRRIKKLWSDPSWKAKTVAAQRNARRA